MSLRARLINLGLRLVEKRRLARVEAPEDLRAGFERSARLFLHAPRGSRFSAREIGGRPGLEALGPGVGTPAKAILHFPGGGYVMGSPRTHRAMVARLSQLTGRAGLLQDYRKAPEHRFPAPVDDALAAWDEAAARFGAENIVIGGDSAGGGLVLALLGEICRRGLPMPGGCYAMSPFTDMTFSGASFTANAAADAMLPNARARELEDLYLAGADPRDPRASPLFADFTGACPVWLCVGDTEILLDDTRRMAERLVAQGVAAEVEIARDLPHVWPMFHGLMPEADATLRRLSGWINSRQNR